MANCKPCQDKGRVVVAHYQASGKQPALCYYCRNNQPHPLDQVKNDVAPAREEEEIELPKQVAPARREFNEEEEFDLDLGPGAEEEDEFDQSEEDEEETIMSDTSRTCAAEGCTKKLRVNNRSGRCTKHSYVGKAEKPSKSAPPPRRNGKQPEENGVERDDVFSVRLSETQIDGIWNTLSPQQKAQLIGKLATN